MLRCTSAASEADRAIPPALVREFLIAAAVHRVDDIRYYIEDVGFHPDTTFGTKPTALCYAVRKPNLELMSYLIRTGASVNYADEMGMTPLHFAAIGGCPICLSYLVCAGADTRRLNAHGQSALDLCRGCATRRHAEAFLARLNLVSTCYQEARKRAH